MPKITLGKQPKTFPKTVSFPMLDGTTGIIKVTYKYRTRKEFGSLVDELREAAGIAPTSDSEEFSFQSLMERTTGSNADYILRVVEGWDLESEFTREAVEQLADEVPAAVNAIMEDYRAAITQGRLGNS